METHLYTMFFFLFLSQEFSYEHSERFLTFFFCRVSISRVMNATQKKKTRNSSGKTRAMESHFYDIDFYFLSRQYSYEHSERFLTFFPYAVLVFVE